jgi:hypothetical protein
MTCTLPFVETDLHRYPFIRGGFMGFRSLSVSLVAAIVALGLLVAAPAANASERPNPQRTYIVDCVGDLQFKPKEIIIACADAGVDIQQHHLDAVEQQPCCRSGDVIGEYV